MTTKFKIQLETHSIEGTYDASPEELLSELQKKFIKGDLYEIGSTKGTHLVNLSLLQFAEVWEE